MAVVIFILSIIVIMLLIRAGKMIKKHGRKLIQSETTDEQKRREANELITVILPVIRNDK